MPVVKFNSSPSDSYATLLMSPVQEEFWRGAVPAGKINRPLASPLESVLIEDPSSFTPNGPREFAGMPVYLTSWQT